MTQPRVRNVAMAVLLAGIGAGALIIIWLGTTLSAMTQLFFAVVGFSSFVAATFTICRVVPPMGHAFVIRERKGPRVVRGIAFLPPWQVIDSILLTTPKWIEASFEEPPYPKTLDWLPVKVKVRAKVAFEDTDEALIEAAAMEKNKLDEEWKRNLEGIISRVLSEKEYHEHVEQRNEFEKAVDTYWHSSNKLLKINIVEIEQVNLDDAGLSDTDKIRAKTTIINIKAIEDSKQAQSKKISATAAADILKTEEDGKRSKIDEEHKTKIEEIQKAEEQKRTEKAVQHESKMKESQQQAVIAFEKNKNDLSQLEREVALAKQSVETEKAKRDFSNEKADTNRIAKIADKKTALEVEKIHTDLLKNRAEGELDLEKQYVEVRRKELEMLKTNKDGDLRYLLAKEALEMSVEQSKAIAVALGKARIIGTIGDLPQIEKILKAPIAFREILAGFLDVMDDELVQGVGRFFRGVASIRKETQSPAHKTNSSTQTVGDGVESQTSSTSQDASASKKNEAPPPPNDGNFDN